MQTFGCSFAEAINEFVVSLEKSINPLIFGFSIPFIFSFNSLKCPAILSFAFNPAILASANNVLVFAFNKSAYALTLLVS